jgi:hypothetical protein
MSNRTSDTVVFIPEEGLYTGTEGYKLSGIDFNPLPLASVI